MMTGCLERCVRLFVTTSQILPSLCCQACGFAEEKEVGCRRIAGQIVQVSNQFCCSSIYYLYTDVYFGVAEAGRS